MTKKLKIIGPYTPEHPGPFCTRDGRPARIICTDRKGWYSTVALVTESDGKEDALSFYPNGRYKEASDSLCDVDLMNAEEVPVAREFWVNEYADGYMGFHKTEQMAVSVKKSSNFLRTIHVREVMPEELGGVSAGVNWPNHEQPGEPMFPDQDGWHWLRNEESGGVYPLKWFCRKGDSRAFWDGDGRKIFPHLMAATSYVGMALVPAQTPEVLPGDAE